MKNLLFIGLLLVGGSIASGYISKAGSNYTASKYTSGNYSYAEATPLRRTSPVPAAAVFPVAGKKSVIGSFWGAAREGGNRKHEGIDIFAKKGTPVVAVTEGMIVDVGNTPRGGKTVWLRSYTDDFYYYYAHLDKQLVQAGQSVKKGAFLGTVGNTGNARLTPSHLHFGIYSYSGAIDPLPHVKKLPKVAYSPPAKKSKAKPIAAR